MDRKREAHVVVVAVARASLVEVGEEVVVVVEMLSFTAKAKVFLFGGT